jgi:hypothetical protein
VRATSDPNPLNRPAVKDVVNLAPLFTARRRLSHAERAVTRPWTRSRSLRLDRALVDFEQALELLRSRAA